MDTTSTLQTIAPLTQLRASKTIRSVGSFKDLNERNDQTVLDLNQPYQRGDVWRPTRRGF